MNNSAGVSHPPPQRPPYPPSNVSYRSDYSQANGRPSPVGAQSPQMMNFGSPSPQSQFSPPFSQPAAKRPRLSPDAPSPYDASQYPQTPTGQSRSPMGGLSANGVNSQQPRPGAMAPPQRPLERDQSDGQQDNKNWGSMGVNIDEEDRNLSRMDWGSSLPSGSLQTNQTGLSSSNNSFSQSGTAAPTEANDANATLAASVSAEEKQRRIEERADWEAARHSQNPLWDMFLYGGSLNNRLRKISQQEHLTDPQAGVLVNTHKMGAPPIARVNGQEGASRLIDKGQAILEPHKGERLADIIKCITLASKSRLTGLMSASSRLALERRQHSKGKIPTEWEDIGVALDTSAEAAILDGAEGGTSANPLKRTHDQANSDELSHRATSVGPSRQLTMLAKVMAEEKIAEDARRAKRAKRKALADAAAQSAQKAAEEEAVTAATENDAKKTTKAMKAEQNKKTADVQHQTVNSAAQMALGGKKSKKYSWMQGGSASGTSTPSRLGMGGSSASSTPKPIERPKPVVKEKQFAAWDEDKDPGIQARDLLLVLETDGKALRAYTKGCAMLGD